jgi:hypothetical protein
VDQILKSGEFPIPRPGKACQSHLALFKLVSVEDATQVVAVQEIMEEATKIAGYGDIYKGLYIVAEGEARFEYFGNVVAKKNRTADGNKSEAERRLEVSWLMWSIDLVVLIRVIQFPAITAM